MQFHSWGVSFSPDMYHSMDLESCSCGASIPYGIRAQAKFLVGFTTEGSCPASTRKLGRVGIGIFECPKCFSKFWYHLMPETAEVFSEHCPAWPKGIKEDVVEKEVEIPQPKTILTVREFLLSLKRLNKAWRNVARTFLGQSRLIGRIYKKDEHLYEFIFMRYHRTRSEAQSLELSQNAERKRLGRREGGEKSKQKR